MVPDSLIEALDWIDWYVTCLQDVLDKKVVRGLAEAEAGYLSAINYINQVKEDLYHD